MRENSASEVLSDLHQDYEVLLRRMFSPRGFLDRAVIHVLASWISLISMSQLEGEC